MMDPTLLPNPKKVVLYRPSVPLLISVLHGAERGERSALFLSPLRPSFKNPGTNVTQSGSQFTLFLAAPLQAFCQLVAIVSSDKDMICFDDADGIISAAFAEWERLSVQVSDVKNVIISRNHSSTQYPDVSPATFITPAGDKPVRELVTDDACGMGLYRVPQFIKDGLHFRRRPHAIKNSLKLKKTSSHHWIPFQVHQLTVNLAWRPGCPDWAVMVRENGASDDTRTICLLGYSLKFCA